MIIIKFIFVVVLLLVPIQSDTPEQSFHSNRTSYDPNFKQELQCIREALYFEARGEGEEGMRSVLSVIHNRTKAKGFPGSYCSVIHQPLQFSYRNGTQPGIHIDVKPVKPTDKKAYELATFIAEEVVTGEFKPTLQPNVLWYHTKNVKPRWSKVMERVKTVANHQFFAKRS